MRLACGDVLAVQVPVNVDRGVDLRHDRVGARREAPAPHFVAHDTVTKKPSPRPEMKQTPFFSRFRFMPAAFILGAMGGLALVYGMGGFQRNAGFDPACRPAADLAKK